MKKLLLIFSFLGAFFLLNAQAPQGISYQAVVRDANGNVIANQQVQFRFTILQDAYNGQEVFQEVQNTTTNSLGIVNLTIGSGVPYIGNISEIDWGNHSHYLRVEIDPQANNNFTELGVTQLVSVPYALFANICGNAVTYNAGNGIDITNGVITNTAPDQIVTLNAGPGVSITGSYPNFTITSTATEYTAGNGIEINNGIITNTAPDQIVTINAGPGVSVSGSYPNFTVTNSAPDQTIILNSGYGINVYGTYPTYTIDHGIHTGDVSGALDLVVTGIQNRPVSGITPSTNQVLKWNGNSWTPANDENTTYSAGTGLSLTGTTFSHSAHSGDVSGTTSLTVIGLQNKPISTIAPTTGQVLQYNGSQWTPVNSSSLITAGSGLSYSGSTLNSVWSINGNNIYNNNTGNVGIGILNPSAKLSITDTSNLIFQIKDKLGRPVFEVYQDSVKVYISSGPAKSNKGAFVINPKMDSGKQGEANYSYLTVTPDSTQVTTENPDGGFSVNDTSNNISNYVNITPENYFIGHSAGKNNTSGLYNIFIGYESGKSSWNGHRNILVGYHAGKNATTSDFNDNIFVGDSAGLNNNSFRNIFIGNNAGQNNTAYENIYIGVNSGRFGIQGQYNTYVGTNTGLYSTGSLNTFIGNSSGKNNTSGQYNVFMGTDAGMNNTSGSYNTFIGESSSSSNITGGSNTSIGCFAGPIEESLNNIASLGYNSRPYMDNMVWLGNSATQVISGAVDFSIGSDKRIKTNIKEDVPGLDFIMKLRPVTYNLDVEKMSQLLGEDYYIDRDGKIKKIDVPDYIIKARKEKSLIRYTGLIAQEVEQAAKEIGYDFSGVVKPSSEDKLYSLRYSEFTVPIIKAIQEQQQQINELKQIINDLKIENQKLKVELNNLKVK